MPVLHPLPPALREAAALLRLGLPVIAAQLAQMAMGVADTIMVGRVGATELAAVAVGTSLWNPLYLFTLGLLMATSASVAHLFGAQRHAEIGRLVHQALWLAAALALPVWALLRDMGAPMHWLGVDPAIVPVAQDYLDALAWGVPAAFLYVVLRFANEGVGATAPAMLIGFIGLASNVFGNWLLIYGHWGLPALGARGCGYATAASLWLMLVLLVRLSAQQPRLAATGLFARLERPRLDGLGPLLRLGLPIGIGIFAETSIFAAIALVLGVLGAVVVAGHQIALNVASFAFMVPLSLSIAASVRVGHALGAGDARAARRAGDVAIALCGVCMGLSALTIYNAAPMIVALYTSDAAVAALAVQLLGYAALFQLSDGLQVGAAGALRGAKDTRVPTAIMLFAYWGVAFPLGYGLAFAGGLGPRGLWTGLIVGLTLAALLLNLRWQHLIRRPRSTP